MTNTPNLETLTNDRNTRLNNREKQLLRQIEDIQRMIDYGLEYILWCGDLISTTIIENQFHKLHLLRSSLELDLLGLRVVRGIDMSFENDALHGLLKDIPLVELLSDITEWIYESSDMLEKMPEENCSF